MKNIVEYALVMLIACVAIVLTISGLMLVYQAIF